MTVYIYSLHVPSSVPTREANCPGTTACPSLRWTLEWLLNAPHTPRNVEGTLFPLCLFAVLRFILILNQDLGGGKLFPTSGTAPRRRLVTCCLFRTKSSLPGPGARSRNRLRLQPRSRPEARRTPWQSTMASETLYDVADWSLAVFLTKEEGGGVHVIPSSTSSGMGSFPQQLNALVL